MLLWGMSNHWKLNSFSWEDASPILEKLVWIILVRVVLWVTKIPHNWAPNLVKWVYTVSNSLRIQCGKMSSLFSQLVFEWFNSGNWLVTYVMSNEMKNELLLSQPTVMNCPIYMLWYTQKKMVYPLYIHINTHFWSYSAQININTVWEWH